MVKDRILVITCLLLAAFLPSAAEAQNYRTHDGHEFSVSLKADKPTIMLGETTFLSFEIKNHSKARLAFGDGGDYRNNIGRPESYSVTVLRDDGKPVPQPKVTISMGGLFGAQYVPINGAYVRRLFVPHWATFEEPGTYTVTVTRSLGIAGTDPPLFGVSKTGERPLITTKATTTLTVITTDNDRLGDIIRDVGTRMLSEPERTDAREAVQLLEFIRDPRTIEYWIKAVRAYSQDLNADGFHRFARTPRILVTYDTTEAWAQLRSAMKSKSENVRLDVADALGASNNEQGLPLLLKMQNDAYYFVRLRVAQRLDKEQNDDATEILLRLLNDQNQHVWESAERSLQARDRMPKDFPLRPLSALQCAIRQVKTIKRMQSLGGQSDGTAGSSGVFLGGVTCEDALTAFRNELSEHRTANNTLGEAWALYQLGDIYRDSRRYELARDNYELALRSFRTLKNREAQRELLSELAIVSELLNRYKEALKYLDEELSLVRMSTEESVRTDEGRLLNRMSELHFILGDDQAGIESLLNRLDWEREQKSDYGQFIALTSLGKGYERIGNKPEALAAYERALLVSRAVTFESELLNEDLRKLKADIQRLR